MLQGKSIQEIKNIVNKKKLDQINSLEIIVNNSLIYHYNFLKFEKKNYGVLVLLKDKLIFNSNKRFGKKTIFILLEEVKNVGFVDGMFSKLIVYDIYGNEFSFSKIKKQEAKIFATHIQEWKQNKFTE